MQKHNHLFYIILNVLLISLLTGCHQSLNMEGFDAEVWENDRYGCQGLRFQYLQVIREHEDYLLRRDQNELEALLGLPDAHELDNRRRKYFFYYLQPGDNCENGLATPVKLQIKFNALGLSTEVFLENY